MEHASRFDVAVIGRGPRRLQRGHRACPTRPEVLLLERDRFARFHIGESQLPWINRELEALGAHDAVVKAGFVEKWGASFSEIEGRPPPTWNAL
jgi:FADH2-dependent halogenase